LGLWRSNPSETTIGICWVNDENASGAGVELNKRDRTKTGQGSEFHDMVGSIITMVDNYRDLEKAKRYVKIVANSDVKLFNRKFNDDTNKEVLDYFRKELVQPNTTLIIWEDVLVLFQKKHPKKWAFLLI
jgi:hypothetical protein